MMRTGRDKDGRLIVVDDGYYDGYYTDKDNVNHPDHYKAGGIEVIDILKAKLPREMYLGFLHGNVIKYVLRAQYKGKETEDLEKAEWYLKRLIDEYKGTEKPYLEGMQEP